MFNPIDDLLVETYEEAFCQGGVDAAVNRVEKRAAEKRKLRLRRLRLRRLINDSLKPCPFCGGRARIEEKKRPDRYVSYTVKFVQCTSCHSKTDERICDGYHSQYCSDEEISALWNKRVKED